MAKKKKSKKFPYTEMLFVIIITFRIFFTVFLALKYLLLIIFATIL